MSPRVQSVERSIDILLALANGSRTLTEVARATGLSKGTAFRLLASLGHQQLVVKEPAANIYLLGPGFLRMFQGMMGDLGSLATIARPALQELWEATSETIAMHVPIGSERVCVAELPSPEPIRYTSTVGATAPLHVGSAGKVLLASLPPEKLAKTLAALPLTSLTQATITEEAALRQELSAVARQGWAMSAGERISGAAAISVPVRGQPDVLAALSILGPAGRLTTQRRLAMLPDLQRAAQRIEAMLAATGAAIEDDIGSVPGEQ